MHKRSLSVEQKQSHVDAMIPAQAIPFTYIDSTYADSTAVVAVTYRVEFIVSL